MGKFVSSNKLFFLGHLLFWVVMFAQDLVLLYDYEEHDQGQFELHQILTDLVLDLISKLTLFYTNYFFFTPQFLKRKKFFLFFSAILGLSLLIDSIYYLIDADFSIISSCSECIILHVVSIVSFTLFSSLFRYSVDWAKYFEKSKHIEIQNKEMQISILKNQINPHFFFNNLNSLYSLCIHQDKDAGNMVLKLASIMRHLIYEGDKAYISLSKEVELLKDYIELQNLKKTKSKQVEFYQEGVEKAHKIAPLILINFLENAYKHSNIFLDKASFIDISIIVSNDWLWFSIENSVSSVQSENIASGIGLQNLRKQLELLYPGKFELLFTSSDETYKVDLKLKLI